MKDEDIKRTLKNYKQQLKQVFHQYVGEDITRNVFNSNDFLIPLSDIEGYIDIFLAYSCFEDSNCEQADYFYKPMFKKWRSLVNSGVGEEVALVKAIEEFSDNRITISNYEDGSFSVVEFDVGVGYKFWVTLQNPAPNLLPKKLMSKYGLFSVFTFTEKDDEYLLPIFYHVFINRLSSDGYYYYL